jgi:hypothetical protein
VLRDGGVRGVDDYLLAKLASSGVLASVSRRKIFWYTFAAVAGGLTWMMLLGLSVAHRVADAGTTGTASAIRDLMGGGALGALAMIAIYLATVAADIVNDYTGSLSLQAAGITVRRPAIALINGTAAFGFSAWFLYAPGALYDQVENLLLFFTYWISAWLGVVGLRRQPPGVQGCGRLLRVRPAAPGRPRVHCRVRGRCGVVPGAAAPPRHANPGNPAVTAAPATAASSACRDREHCQEVFAKVSLHSWRRRKLGSQRSRVTRARLSRGRSPG